MIDNVRSMLSALVPDPPEDLVSHFSRDDLPRVPDLCINVLPLADAAEYTRRIREHVTLGEILGLVVLDDANNSNPFCYVTKGLLRGQILHLAHDDDTHVAFRSLEGFMASISDAVRDRRWIEELRDDRPFLTDDQDALAARIGRFLAEDGVDDIEAVVMIPLLDTSRLDIMKSLASHPDFYIREAAAQQITAWPNIELLAVAEALAGDKYPQVARPGRQAESAIRRLKSATE